MANAFRSGFLANVRNSNPNALWEREVRRGLGMGEAETLVAEWRASGRFARVTMTRARGLPGWTVRGFVRASEWEVES